MRSTLFALVVLAGCNCIAVAGPNSGGTLIINATHLEYCAGDRDLYCDLELNAGCEGADPNEAGGSVPIVWTIHAAFAEGTSPRLFGVTFGLDDYDDSQIIVIDSGACGDFALPDVLWPGPDTGTAVSWNSVETGQTTQVYWIAGYAYYTADVSLGLQAHPNQGGDFVDDSVPPILDSIAAYGSLGFNNNQGRLPCPTAGGPVGACCVPGELDCIVLTPEECDAVDGDYLGDFTTCSPDPCPKPGACCFGSGLCVVLEGIDCQTAGGVFLGDSIPCDPNPCPQPGACCSPDGICTMALAVDCRDEYQGDGTVCEPNPCPQPPPTGACCAPDGSCRVTTEADCVDEYEGDETVCEPNPCPQPPPMGACCTADGSCTVTTGPDCLDDYQGDDTVCKPNTCPNAPAIGACCDVRNGSCRLVAAEECNRALEFYRGNGTYCDPNRCPWLDGSVTPTAGVSGSRGVEPEASSAGACCADDGSCLVTPEALCTGVDYLGDDTECDPNPCDLTPAIERTWGWIKFAYR